MDNLTDIKEIWQEMVKNLGTEIGSEAVDLWVRPIKPLVLEGDTIKLEVPDSIIYNTVKQRYEEKIITLLAQLTGKTLKLNYSMSLAQTEPPPQSKATPASVALPANYYSFNPNYTFESFIMGTSNRFAFASAEGVAKTPGQTNPFFIYSAPGLGKTHLLHASRTASSRTIPRRASSTPPARIS